MWLYSLAEFSECNEYVSKPKNKKDGKPQLCWYCVGFSICCARHVLFVSFVFNVRKRVSAKGMRVRNEQNRERKDCALGGRVQRVWVCVCVCAVLGCRRLLSCEARANAELRGYKASFFCLLYLCLHGHQINHSSCRSACVGTWEATHYVTFAKLGGGLEIVCFRKFYSSLDFACFFLGRSHSVLHVPADGTPVQAVDFRCYSKKK